MSGKVVTLYDVEAEIPPGCPTLSISAGDRPTLCDGDGDIVRVCIEPEMIEVFAATAAMRWSDLTRPKRRRTPRDDDKIVEATGQYVAWEKIREKAINAQVARRARK